MTMVASNGGDSGHARLRWIGWGAVAALLLVPLIAMQFTGEVRWSAGDFLLAALMLGGLGLGVELAVRLSPDWHYRAGAALAGIMAVVTVWGNLAVGFIGDEGNPANLVFAAMLLVIAGGAALVRLRAAGLARVMTLAAVMQAGAAVLALTMGDDHGALLIALLVVPWMAASWLFRTAARLVATD